MGGNNSKCSAITNVPNFEECQQGGYIACIYDPEWYIGLIVEISEVCRDVYVKFMKRFNELMLLWSQDYGNKCWIPLEDILCIISSPEPQGSRARQFKIKSTEYDLIMERATQRI